MVKFKRTLLAVSVSIVITACGGGGGGGSSTLGAFVNRDVPFYTPVRIDSVQPKVDAVGYTYDSSALISQDLNGDGTQSLILAGRQDPSHATYHDYRLQVWDWENGTLVNRTSQWFSGTDNHVTGTEPSVQFGDFDNDGRVDMYVAPHTDTQIYGPGIVFFNEGNRFTRQNIDLDNTHGHGSSLYDLNGDGYLDIVTTGLRFTFGGPNRTFTTHWGRGDYPGGGGDVAVADFMGNGTASLVLTDMGSNQHSNNRLYTWSMQHDGVHIHETSILPTPRFLLPRWQNYGFTGSHDIRALAFDFDNSGLSDVVIFSRPWLTNGQWPNYSEIQFNRNHGGGIFEDVTDSVLIGYDTTMPVTYNPVLVDVNNDGLIDIVLGNTGWENNRGAQVLVHTQDHRFVASYADVLKAFVDQSYNLERAIHNSASFGANGVAFVNGPNNQMYLATAVSYQQSGVQKKAIYLSLLGNMTPSAAATADVVRQAWPWMSSSAVNQTLANSSIQYINGLPIVDFVTAMSPIGGLGISTNGRTGTRQTINGHISVPGLDSKILSNVVAVDSLSRNFTVDISSMQYHSQQSVVSFSEVANATESWSSRFVGEQRMQHNGWHAANSGSDYSVGLTVPLDSLDKSWSVSISRTEMSGSPWLSFSGIFGSVERSSIVETSLNRRWKNGYWAQLGVMQTATQINPGLVTGVKDIWSVHAVGGWTNNAWSMYGGVQPTVVRGSVDIRLPDRVDQSGTLHYANHRAQVRTKPVSFAGVRHSYQYQNQKITTGAVINSLGQYQAKINYTLAF